MSSLYRPLRQLETSSTAVVALLRMAQAASGGWRFRILDFYPGLRRTRFINGCKPLRHDPLKSEIANGGKKFVAGALSMFNVLDALSRLGLTSTAPIPERRHVVA
jgi:hypothetical protein